MTKKTILVLHFAGQMPLAGIAWQAVNYVVGLTRLGYDAWYVEDNGVNPYSPRENALVWDSTFNRGFVKAMMERHGLGHRWAYWDPIKGGSFHGLDRDGLYALYAKADAIFNLCGATRLRDEHMRCPIRVYVETDPGYEQIRLYDKDPIALDYLGAHTHFFTYGENLGASDCPLPVGETVWHKTRPPVVLDLWQPDFARQPTHYSSVATWQNKGKDIAHKGQLYQWSKHVNFERFLDLPKRAPHARFRLAMMTPNRKLNAMIASHGWELVDPVPISETMERYAEFIHDSRAEFTVAKDVYVRARCGWSSDRSVTYLAAGRPVITQGTAADKYVPGGCGLFYFNDWDDILAAIDAVESDYTRHCRAARDIAETYFASDRLLRTMTETIGL